MNMTFGIQSERRNARAGFGDCVIDGNVAIAACGTLGGRLNRDVGSSQ